MEKQSPEHKALILAGQAKARQKRLSDKEIIELGDTRLDRAYNLALRTMFSK